VIERLLLTAASWVSISTLSVPLRMASAAQASAMMQEAFGAYRAVVNDSPESVRAAAWAEVAETLKTFHTATGLIAPRRGSGSRSREARVSVTLFHVLFHVIRNPIALLAKLSKAVFPFHNYPLVFGWDH
jgi:hypothetical protein